MKTFLLFQVLSFFFLSSMCLPDGWNHLISKKIRSSKAILEGESAGGLKSDVQFGSDKGDKTTITSELRIENPNTEDHDISFPSLELHDLSFEDNETIPSDFAMEIQNISFVPDLQATIAMEVPALNISLPSNVSQNFVSRK
jgi:hypothetical protein